MFVVRDLSCVICFSLCVGCCLFFFPSLHVSFVLGALLFVMCVCV